MIFGPPNLPPPRKEGDWHPFFALWPRHIEGVGYAWCELIERKSKWYASPGGGFYLHEYRLPDPPWRCREGDHEWVYLGTPWGPLRDYCKHCKQTESKQRGGA